MEYKEIRLKNGAKLYVMQMPNAKTVGLGVYVNVGTRDEIWPEQAGIAHATEHMLFQGTEEFPDSKSLTEYLELVGGKTNALTWQEMTFYFNLLPSEEMERGVKILSQMVRKPLLLPEKIETEMKNIIEEFHMTNDNPVSFLDDKFYEVLYENHPLGKRTLGLEDSVKSFSKEDFQKFLEKFYHPANLTFLAIGGIKPGRAAKFFEKHFPKVNSHPQNTREHLIVASRAKNIIIPREIEQAHTRIGALAPAGGTKESSILKFFITMIDGGMSFPLFQEVRDKRGLCYAIMTDYQSWSDVGIFSVYVGTDPRKTEEAKKIIIDVIHESKTLNELLEKAKNVARGNLKFVFESPKSIIRPAAFSIAFNGKPGGYKEALNQIDSFTIKEVEAVVNKYLNPEQLITVSLVPKS